MKKLLNTNSYFKKGTIYTGSLHVILVAILFLSSPNLVYSQYFQHRIKDSLDIVTLSGEKKVVGFNAKASIVTLGLQHGHKAKGYGLRSGNLGHYAAGRADDSQWLKTGNSLLLLNSSHHHMIGSKGRNAAKKAYTIKSSMGGLLIYHWQGYNAFYQFEISMGLYLGFRFGFNVAEVADFILGWSTLDILADDL